MILLTPLCRLRLARQVLLGVPLGPPPLPLLLPRLLRLPLQLLLRLAALALVLVLVLEREGPQVPRPRRPLLALRWAPTVALSLLQEAVAPMVLVQVLVVVVV